MVETNTNLGGKCKLVQLIWKVNWQLVSEDLIISFELIALL